MCFYKVLDIHLLLYCGFILPQNNGSLCHKRTNRDARILANCAIDFSPSTPLPPNTLSPLSNVTLPLSRVTPSPPSLKEAKVWEDTYITLNCVVLQGRIFSRGMWGLRSLRWHDVTWSMLQLRMSVCGGYRCHLKGLHKPLVTCECMKPFVSVFKAVHTALNTLTAGGKKKEFQHFEFRFLS